MFWLPVFFLYFSSFLTVSEVLLLEAIYYAGVVALEVPSGYLSDRVGRRVTLMAGMSTWIVACTLFATLASFPAFAAAQLLLAAGMAFNSGTDSSMLYDSLEALNRQDEFADREAQAQALGYAALAASALVGGILSGFDLRYAYVLSSFGALGALLCATGFAEPSRRRTRNSIQEQLAALRALGSVPVLRWMFAFSIGMTVINHVPYELFQPWVDLYLGSPGTAYSRTPATTGALVAVMMALSAVASTRAVALRNRIGTSWVLVGSTLLQAAIIGSLAAPAHGAILGLLALRSVPQGLARPVAMAAIHPHLPSSVRATWLSIQSLGGRMAFSVALTSAALWTADAPLTHAVVATLSAVSAVLAVLFAVLLLATRPTGLDASSQEPSPPSGNEHWR